MNTNNKSTKLQPNGQPTAMIDFYKSSSPVQMAKFAKGPKEHKINIKSTAKSPI
jgi:hypothetical protein